MKEKKRFFFLVLSVICMLLITPSFVKAAKTDTDTSDYETSIEESVDYESIQDMLDSMELEEIDFKNLVEAFIDGEVSADTFLEKLMSLAGESIFGELLVAKSALIQIFLLILLSAILIRFSDVFEKPQISELSFYMVYMMLMLLLICSFSKLNETVTTSLNQLVDFMRIIVPTYSLILAVTAGKVSAVGFYEIAIIVIYLIERIFLAFILPLIHVFVVVVLADRFFEEEYLSRMAELIKSVISWSIKGMFGLVVGMNLVQSMISPAIDSLKANVVARSFSAIPGIGNALGSVTQIMIGSGIVVKNGVGAAVMVILFIYSLGPCIKLAVVAAAFKILAAILQPVADGRMIGSLSDVGEGMFLMTKVLMSAQVLFLLQIAMITVSSGWIRT